MSNNEKNCEICGRPATQVVGVIVADGEKEGWINWRWLSVNHAICDEHTPKISIVPIESFSFDDEI